jgi:4-hydroxy-tetrahydrodipicolinate synthase
MARYKLSEARRWVRTNLRGYMTALYTPFRENGDVDEDALVRNVELTLSLPGVGGLSLNSIHQEFWTLTDAERMRVTELVLRTVDGRKPGDRRRFRHQRENRHRACKARAECRRRRPDGLAAVLRTAIERGRSGLLQRGRQAHRYRHVRLQHDLVGVRILSRARDGGIAAPARMSVRRSLLDDEFAAYASMMERVGGDIAVSNVARGVFLVRKAVDAGAGARLPDGLLQAAVRPELGSDRTADGSSTAALSGDYVRAGAVMREIVGIADKLQSRYFAQGFHPRRAVQGAVGESRTRSVDRSVRLPARPKRPSFRNVST